jgi:Mg2+ and Co2+ transporter CorA
MLALQTRDLGVHEVVDDLDATTLPSDVIWIDMMTPTPQEVAYVERTTGLQLPNRAEIS